MTVASDVLSLRRDQSSSVQLLLGALEWERSAYGHDHRVARRYAVLQAVDLVLLNVAAHASEQQTLFAETGFSLIPPKRPAKRTAFRKTPRRRIARHLRQLAFAPFA